MTSAGFEPRTRLPSPNGAPLLRRSRRAPYVYVHRCAVCQAFRAERRLMSRWRCAACVASGLEGPPQHHPARTVTEASCPLCERSSR